LAFCEEFGENKLIETRRLLFVHSSQSSSRSWSHAKMIEQLLLGFQVMDDVLKTFTTWELPDQHRHEIALTVV